MAWYRSISVEVPILLSFFVTSIVGPINSNLVIYRTCYIILGYNESDCALLGNENNNITQHLEKLVQPTSQILTMVQSTVSSIFTIIICISLGPWSDKFGRRPILLLCQAGMTLNMLLMSLFSAIPNISPWYFFISAIPSMLTGGFPTYMTVCLSYISDVSMEETRGMRMGLLEAAVAIGLFIGHLTSSYLFYATNYMSVFLIAALFSAVGFVYSYFCIPESIQNIETEGKLRGLIQTENLLGMVKVVIKRRENFNRSIILIISLISAIFVLVMYGDGAIMFLFLREKLNWTLSMYTIYSSFNNIIWILGTVLGAFFLHKVLQIKESVLLIAGVLSLLNCSVMQGLASNNFHIYAASFAKSIGGLTSPMLRTLISKLVSKEEIGKIFSMIMICEFVLGLAGSPLYTVIYNKTIDTDPGLFNFVTAGFYVFMVILILIVVILEYFTSPNIYSAMEDEEVENVTTN
ncbi:hypothetical protein JTB14_022504 [Gonioctena quinquepunctata]|nr:hypothetical protein JTB14_022504 [Gonioctena quinquepunctata]